MKTLAVSLIPSHQESYRKLRQALLKKVTGCKEVLPVRIGQLSKLSAAGRKQSGRHKNCNCINGENVPGVRSNGEAAETQICLTLS